MKEWIKFWMNYARNHPNLSKQRAMKYAAEEWRRTHKKNNK